MDVITFVDGVAQRGFLGQFPSSFEIHDYYDGKNITSFTMDFDDDVINSAFYEHLLDNFPDLAVDIFDNSYIMGEDLADFYDDIGNVVEYIDGLPDDILDVDDFDDTIF